MTRDEEILDLIELLLTAEIFNQHSNLNVNKIGLEDTLFSVLYPLLNKIGILWQIGTISPAQEHFISNLIRQKLFAAIDSISPEAKADSKTFLLVLPEWELHDIGLLVYNYLIRKKGHKTIFLGQGIPISDIETVKRQTNPDVVVTSFSSSVVKDKMVDYLNQLSKLFPKKPVYVCGIQQDKLSSDIPRHVHKVATSLDFRDKVLINY